MMVELKKAEHPKKPGYWITKIVLLILFMSLSTHCFAQNMDDAPTKLSGVVFNKAGAPLALVNVRIKGTFSGAVTDSSGYFSFTIQKSGIHVLVASMIGYEKATKKVKLLPGKKLSLMITLQEKVVALDELEVSASSFSMGLAKGVTLSPLEVVTTPGAAADIFRAFKTFPGVSIPGVGSGLFVRGGNVNETKVILDQATLVHPYRFKSPLGRARGTIPPFLVSGTYFSTGGFPARYGNALSAVLVMKSQGLPHSTTANFNLSMAAASAGLSAPIIDDKLGVRFSGNRTFTKFMLEVNGQADEFQQTPVGWDANLSLIYQPSPNAIIKFFNFAQHSELGVRTRGRSFTGIFNSSQNNRLHNLQWKQFWDDWMLKTSFSFNRFDSKINIGGFNLHQQTDLYKIRSDLEHQISEDIQLRVGAVWQYTENSFIGSVPDQENVYDPDATFTVLNEQYSTKRAGAYAELKFRLSRKILANIGLRSDLQTQAGQAVFDPRLNLLYQFNDYAHLRLAVGLYHQFPEPYQFNPETGNPNLYAQQAWHYILGFEYERNLLHLRVEGYYKDYKNLVIKANTANLLNRGYGRSWGFDIFIKYSQYLKTRFNGWISYSFLQSDRYQAQDTGDKYIFQFAPSDFDITHNLSLVGKVRLVDFLYLGVAYRFATGRPITPIVGANYIEKADYYEPIEGPVNSQRLPNFHRLNVMLSYYWPFTSKKAAIFYIAVSNVLNHTNVTDYTYNQNYSQRMPVYSDYTRSVYAGVTINLGL